MFFLSLSKITDFREPGAARRVAALRMRWFAQQKKQNHTHIAIFIPISERFFLSSHTGLWRLCRYALTPILLTNSTLPQLLTKLIATDANEISRLRKDIAAEPYINDWLNFTPTNFTTIDNRLKQALFANWARDTKEFPKIKAKYRTLAANLSHTLDPPPPPPPPQPPASKEKKITYFVLPIQNYSDVFGNPPIQVQLNATKRATVIVPRHLQLALFDEWPEKQQIIYLLGKFAKDMDLPIRVTSKDGAQLVLRPPDPPSKGEQNSDYLYENYGMLFEYRFQVPTSTPPLPAMTKDASKICLQFTKTHCMKP